MSRARPRQPYWTITDDLERLSDAVQFSELLSGLTEQFGPIIHGEDDARPWADAQPDEPHPSEQCDTDTRPTESDATAERELDD